MRPLLVGVMTIGILSGAHSVLAENVPTHCKSGEGQGEVTLFSCPLKKKVVSYCAAPAKPPYKSIEYRYGAVGKVEKTFKAEEGGNKLFGVDSALDPRASVETIWFQEGDLTFSLMQCNGGTCNGDGQDLGLVVMKKDKVISKQFCAFLGDAPQDSFSLFPFDFANNKSNVPFLLPKESPNDPQSKFVDQSIK